VRTHPTDGGDGWIKLHRRLWKNPRSRDPAWVTVWVYLLTHATHKPRRVNFDGRDVPLQPGQLVTGRHAIATATGVHESKVRRVLKIMVRDQQIDQHAGVKGSIITVRNWSRYQASDHLPDQPAASNRPATAPKPAREMTSKRSAKCVGKAGRNTRRAEKVTSKATNDGSPHPQKTTTNKKARRDGHTHNRHTLAEVKKEAECAGLPDSEARACFHYWTHREWRDKSGKSVSVAYAVNTWTPKALPRRSPVHAARATPANRQRWQIGKDLDSVKKQREQVWYRLRRAVSEKRGGATDDEIQKQWRKDGKPEDVALYDSLTKRRAELKKELDDLV